MTSKKYYKLVNEFEFLEDWQEIVRKYPKMFDAICIYNFKLPNRIRNDLFDNLCKGNWEHLWETEEEEKMTIAELCYELRGEVFYCSDRMSWDRLCRIHWIWHRIARILWYQEMDKEIAEIEKEDM